MGTKKSSRRFTDQNNGPRRVRSYCTLGPPPRSSYRPSVDRTVRLVSPAHLSLGSDPGRARMCKKGKDKENGWDRTSYSTGRAMSPTSTSRQTRPLWSSRP